MATLMWWGNSEGTKGRCDAKCHKAKNPHCHCMCGGRYHGGARDGTLQERVEQYGEEILEEAKKKAQEHGVELGSRTVSECLEALADPNKARLPRKRKQKGGA